MYSSVMEYLLFMCKVLVQSPVPQKRKYFGLSIVLWETFQLVLQANHDLLQESLA